MSISQNDVQTAFGSVITDSPFGDSSQVINFTGGFVPVSTFATLFANAADMTAASLQIVDTAGKLGYSLHIQEWQSKGYIK